MKEPENIFQFLNNVYKFIDSNTFTSGLKVDSDNNVEDLDQFHNDVCNAPGGIIAEMQNVASEIIWTLDKHYTDNNCKPELKRLNALRTKFKV